jgi:hypothetical protein
MIQIIGCLVMALCAGAIFLVTVSLGSPAVRQKQQ